MPAAKESSGAARTESRRARTARPNRPATSVIRADRVRSPSPRQRPRRGPRRCSAVAAGSAAGPSTRRHPRSKPLAGRDADRLRRRSRPFAGRGVRPRRCGLRGRRAGWSAGRNRPAAEHGGAAGVSTAHKSQTVHHSPVAYADHPDRRVERVSSAPEFLLLLAFLKDAAHRSPARVPVPGVGGVEAGGRPVDRGNRRPPGAQSPRRAERETAPAATPPATTGAADTAARGSPSAATAFPCRSTGDADAARCRTPTTRVPSAS